MAPRMTRSGSGATVNAGWSTAGADALAEHVLAEVIAETCFAAFQSAELRRLPCSHCSAHHGTLGTGTGAPAAAGVDIYGSRVDNREAGGECAACVVCGKAVGVARYAQHLEKCMGIGGRAAKAAQGTGSQGAARSRASKPADKQSLQASQQTPSPQHTQASDASASEDSDFAPEDKGPRRKAKRTRPQPRKPASRTVPPTANGAVSLIGADFDANPDSLEDMFM